MMNPITSLIKRYPQAAFWAIAWSTFFFGYYMYVQTNNDMWQFLILATFLGGAVVTGIADGRSGLKTYLGRIVRWRVHIKWYAVAIFLPLILRLAAFGLTIATGAETIVNPTWNWGEIVFEAILVFFVIALGEEPAFRGFALVRLMNGRNALKASLILGVLHAIWHLPLFLTGDNSPMVILIIFAGAILNTWLFNNTNGSVLLNMVMHTSVNLWVGIFNPLFSEADAARQTTWLMIAYVAAAVIVTVLSGTNLSRKSDIQTEPVTSNQQLAAN
jgi:membrane protease YdiL (CAAX protease family)